MRNHSTKGNYKFVEESYVVYRYFSTVVYVAIAYANGLTKEIDNYEAASLFLKKNKERNKLVCLDVQRRR